MSIASTADWKGLRSAGEVVRQALDAVQDHAKPGVATRELDRVAAAVFARCGARSAPALVYNFPGAVLLSVNDEVVHGVPGPRRLEDGDVLKIDVTAEKDGYMADAARTIVVGRAPAGASNLLSCVRAAFERALDAARPGNCVSEIGRAIEREVRRHGCSIVRALSGHGIGRTIHEPPTVPNYYDAWQKDVLTEGLVLAIEPIVTAGSPVVVEDRDGWTIRTKDGSLAAHHEHTVVITKGRPIVLTAA
jgi:methionyl aminopeptidase